MELYATRCAICDSEECYTVLYRKNFKESDLSIDLFSARRLPDRIHYQIVRCNKDGLIRSNPIIDQESIYDLYGKSRFTYEQEIENLTISYLDALKGVLPKLSVDAKILEVGCGNGFILKALYKKGYKNVFGVEPSSEAVTKADKEIREKITIDVLRPGIFTPNTFDFIFFFQTLDHIGDPGSFLRICHNLLPSRGYILAFNHDIESLPLRMLGSRSPIIDIEHVYYFSKKTITKIFEKHGFSLIKVYSPADVISLRHIIWLSPVFKRLKIRLLSLEKGIFHRILNKKIRIRVGNLCMIATKTAN
ncbi:MAG: hypothetical protein A2Z72_04210 [Omnitrophica bacterium RBG_13_46_9]|nr:MAG: hypothetical protein A2Z72_04210 [Omnitrophica bacterium RBG_13_46_9]